MTTRTAAPRTTATEPDARLAPLLARLDARERELRQEVGRPREAWGATDAGGREVLSRADEAHARASEVVGDGELERDLAELREIATARQRAAEGRYGLCIVCDAPIEPARLEARPSALRCLACQQAAEWRQRPGRPGRPAQ